jgi:RNA polymerase sigma-70 factor, ECF subfamily
VIVGGSIGHHPDRMSGLGLGSADLARSHLLVDPEAAEREPSAPVHGLGADVGEERSVTADAHARLRALVAEHFDFIWRSLRRLGVPTTDVDDCTQQVFWVAARKLEHIDEGSERAFLFSTALRVASDARRSRARRREVQEEDEAQRCDPGPSPDELADQRKARALLEQVLSSLPLDLRAVFVLFELEEMSTSEIAKLLDIPIGTVASRLRRAREEFQALVGRLKAREAFRGTSTPDRGGER